MLLLLETMIFFYVNVMQNSENFSAPTKTTSGRPAYSPALYQIQSAIAKLLVSFRCQVKIRKGQAGETAWCYGCSDRCNDRNALIFVFSFVFLYLYSPITHHALDPPCGKPFPQSLRIATLGSLRTSSSEPLFYSQLGLSHWARY